jgi:hypothetical protein
MIHDIKTYKNEDIGLILARVKLSRYHGYVRIWSALVCRERVNGIWG